MIDYNNINIKTNGDFFSLLPRVEIDDKAKRMYKRIFDKERDLKENLKNITGWELTEQWLIKNIYLPNKSPFEYLMKGFKAVEMQHKSN